ncbi:uncharacterized protein LOC123565039 isoform X3 [Mercenaria mercenaria]|nr:uncharacterized protein LOC123565039 isoform X3 [Mercenaria mercenaria]XP_053393628.1 uncharacterized protein LOC123565039 isoform X3 [Mercenaria mercenaria]XP_053393629.1 uncharacterized protein LOC123565039 isoform X3 [Mercenaria mercenaria]
MSVYIIAADDAKALANKLRTSLQSTAQHIETIPVAGFLKPKSTRKEKSVNVIFLTTLTWQEIQRQRGDVKRLFSKSLDTVVLSSCAESVTSAAVEMFSKKVVDWESVRLFEASGEEWYKAEARIKYRLSELESGEFHIPCASRYIFKPDSVSTLSESKSEVLIILFGDGTAEYPTDVKKVEVKTAGENLIEAKKIQSNVWSFSALDLAPGDHEVRVLVDSIDIGTNILHVQNQHLIVRELLANFKREDPEGFLAELLRVNKEDFDHDLLDTIGGSSRVSLVETLLKYGDENGYEYPNFLHFCAKYGYKACVDWCQKLPDFKEACMVQNRYGKTPEQVATEAQQNQSLIQTLQTNDAGDEGEYLPTIGSPFKPERFIFGTTRRNHSCPEMTMQNCKYSKLLPCNLSLRKISSIPLLIWYII